MKIPKLLLTAKDVGMQRYTTAEIVEMMNRKDMRDIRLPTAFAARVRKIMGPP